MRLLRLCFWTAAAFVSACGGGDAGKGDSAELGTSYTALCAGAAERHGDIVTAIACPFERQARNIIVYGDELSPQMLIDAEGHPLATVTQSCDSWWLGTDANGLTVLLDSASGRALSHGAIHPGLALSALPGELPTPFTLR